MKPYGGGLTLAVLNHLPMVNAGTLIQRICSGTKLFWKVGFTAGGP